MCHLVRKYFRQKLSFSRYPVVLEAMENLVESRGKWVGISKERVKGPKGRWNGWTVMRILVNSRTGAARAVHDSQRVTMSGTLWRSLVRRFEKQMAQSARSGFVFVGQTKWPIPATLQGNLNTQSPSKNGLQRIMTQCACKSEKVQRLLRSTEPMNRTRIGWKSPSSIRISFQSTAQWYRMIKIGEKEQRFCRFLSPIYSITFRLTWDQPHNITMVADFLKSSFRQRLYKE